MPTTGDEMRVTLDGKPATCLKSYGRATAMSIREKYVKIRECDDDGWHMGRQLLAGSISHRPQIKHIDPR